VVEEIAREAIEQVGEWGHKTSEAAKEGYVIPAWIARIQSTGA